MVDEKISKHFEEIAHDVLKARKLDFESFMVKVRNRFSSGGAYFVS